MNENIERIEALFTRALEFRADERAAFLAGACGQDAILLAKVTALLQAHEAGEAILPERPLAPSTSADTVEKPGDRIGHYKLLEQIGEGGCGVVYMAEQERPVRRRVALKLIKLGMDTKRVVARFEAERQALAMMEHPNIAKVLDGGTTPTGRPYFVMELVRGTRVTDYCERNQLSTAQRLELVIQACRAIQHAHQKGVIHRDIKPSNVLVSVHDGAPVLKVIDFGIAKAIEGRLTDLTLFTSLEQFVGTPAYMSPEQAQLDGLDVDSRTDIYSLGVLLYELLTGKTPFDGKELLSVGFDEMRRTIREKEPVRPSTRVTIELSRSTVSSDRFLQSKELIHALRGDLDWIVMKCLEKERARRYETANGLAMDLQRHLNGEPVVARPPSELYRFQKLVRRNRLVFAAGAAIAVALFLGTVVSSLEALRARRAERTQSQLRVEAERARASESKQRRLAEQRLYEALLGEARAKEFSGQAGQRFESLDAISKASTLQSTTALRDAAIGALALADLRPQKQWQFASHVSADNFCLDDAFALYAYPANASICVRRVDTDRLVASFSVPDARDHVEALTPRVFDPGGRFLAATCQLQDLSWRCRVWDVTRQALVLDLEGACDPDFSSDGHTFAVANPAGIIAVKDLVSGRETASLKMNGKPGVVRFNPNGVELAALQGGASNVWVWDLRSGQLTSTLVCQGKLSGLAWNSDGTLLAAGRQDGDIELWNRKTGRLQAQLQGHARMVTQLAFSHDESLLASASWDHTIRLWDIANAQALVSYRTRDTRVHFSPDDRTLAYAVAGDNAFLLEIAHPAAYRRLAIGRELTAGKLGGFSPDARLAAVASDTGVGIWDLPEGKELGMLPLTNSNATLFLAAGTPSLLTSSQSGLYRWPLNFITNKDTVHIRAGPPECLVSEGPLGSLSIDRGGTRITAASALAPVVLETARPANLLRLKGQLGSGSVAMESSGRWIAAGTWKRSGVSVYEPASGKLLKQLPVKRTAVVAFSPDGNYLATADMMELRFWSTETWEPFPGSLPGDRVSELNPLAFSPDGRVLATVRGSHYEVKLVKVPTCEVLATLRTPSLSALTSLSFSPNGAQLAVEEWGGQLGIWDLRLIRQELKKLNLDWALPPFPASIVPEHQELTKLTFEILSGSSL